tara:strand:+ start:308 stop:832 length:525 start_codon:yes stop_codon:yes gene_type:complete
MLDLFAQSLAPYYLQIKFLHLLFVAAWFMSTAVGYSNYVIPLFRSWQKDPDNIDKARLRNWAFERFDDGVVLEHIAFPMILITGPMLMLAGGWTPAYGWFAMKLVMVVLVFLPLEAIDYYLSHIGLNKEKLRLAGKVQAYETAIHTHWWFLVISTPVVIVSIPFTIYLAVVKPF